MIDPAIGTLLSGAFALLFASAAFHKARHFAHFAAVFRAYRLVPAALPLAAFVPILELSVAAGLLLPVVVGAALLGAGRVFTVVGEERALAHTAGRGHQ